MDELRAMLLRTRQGRSCLNRSSFIDTYNDHQSPRHILILGLGAVTRDFARNWPEPVLARALARRGHRVTAVGYYQPGHPTMTARRETIDGVESLRVPPSIWPGPALARALDRLPRPDVMHIFH